MSVPLFIQVVRHMFVERHALLRMSCGLWLCWLPLFSVESTPNPAVGGEVPYAVDLAHYDNFPAWNDSKKTILTACIQSSKQYRSIFHPAPLMFRTNIFEPDPTTYETKAIIVVAGIFDANVKKPFKVQSVTKKDNVLTFSFSVNKAPPDVGSFWVSASLSVLVPRSDYTQVVFVENHRELRRLNFAAGHWMEPMPPLVQPDRD